MPFRTVAFCRARWRSLPVAAGILAMLSGCGHPPPRSFVRTNAPVIAVEHVRVIDGTGTPSRDDQTVVIRDGRIASVQSASAAGGPAGAAVIDGRGRTLIPGLVGMHEHLFYQMGEEAWAVQEAFARLYLASGVTTKRTAGTFDLKGDASLKADIDAGRVPGPRCT